MLRADSPNRAEWADPAHVTPEIIELYKRPSKLQGWGDAMVEVISPASECFCQDLMSYPFFLCLAHLWS